MVTKRNHPPFNPWSKFWDDRGHMAHVDMLTAHRWSSFRDQQNRKTRGQNKRRNSVNLNPIGPIFATQWLRQVACYSHTAAGLLAFCDVPPEPKPPEAAEAEPLSGKTTVSHTVSRVVSRAETWKQWVERLDRTEESDDSFDDSFNGAGP